MPRSNREETKEKKVPFKNEQELIVKTNESSTIPT